MLPNWRAVSMYILLGSPGGLTHRKAHAYDDAYADAHFPCDAEAARRTPCGDAMAGEIELEADVWLPPRCDQINCQLAICSSSY